MKRTFEYKHIRKFDDIPMLIGAQSQGHVHSETAHWCEIDRWYVGVDSDKPWMRHIIDLNPEYQRGHVWTQDQKVAYIEYCLRGGKTNNTVVFNQRDPEDGSCPYECVDGKQRLTAVYEFVNNKLKVFGSLTCSDLVSASGMKRCSTSYYLTVIVLSLPTREAILRYYLDHNSGGTPHDPSELDRVKKLYDAERRKNSRTR